jgi:hypothetical protein
MRRQSVLNAIRGLMVIGMSSLTASAWPGDAKPSIQPVTDIVRVQAWMPRLVGKFRLEGNVELPGESGDTQRSTIQGQADCHGVRRQSSRVAPYPGVECFFDLTSGQAQGAAPARHSAALLYSYERAVSSVRHMLVDSDGVAEAGMAQLFDDTLISTSPCARLAGKCVNRTSITAGPDLQTVRMEMSMEVDGKKVGGRELTLRRESAP